MSRKPPVETIVYRRQFGRANVRAAYLQAKQRVITAKLAQGRKQLELPLEEQVA